MRKKILFWALLLLFSEISFAETDSLNRKSCEALLTTFASNVEKYAKTDLVFFNLFYIAKKVNDQPLTLEISEVAGNSHEVYSIIFSNIIVGKNVHFKDWGKGSFSIIFSKEICFKKRNQKNKKLEIMFATDLPDRKTDYAVLAKEIKKDFEIIEQHCQQ